MRKPLKLLSGIFLFSLAIWLTTTCRKEEYVIVYSKVSTVRTYSTTSTSTSVEGKIDSLTVAAHDEFGFCYDTLANPTVYKQKFLATGIVQLGLFSGTLTELKPSKTYHVRAFIKDNKKYIYGKDLTFTTSSAVLPTVTTSSVSEITSSSGLSGGNVTKEGDQPVFAKGVCYDTVSTPTVLKNKTMDGWGTGSFTSSLKNLIPEKTYYARAYAASAFGVSYGSQVTFTTKKKLYTFRDDFNNNTNSWYIGTQQYGSASMADGKYVLAYQQTGYLWRVSNDFPDFKAIVSKDFEINTSFKLSSYSGLQVIGSSMYGGLMWNSDNTHFMYFVVKKVLTSSVPTPVYSYSYQAGTYSGSFTVWKDYTSFTGADSIRLSIKKANSKYYFFINGVQVYSRDYVTISYDGVGFYVADSKIQVEYLSIDQKDYKKSGDTEIVNMKCLSGGYISNRFPLK